MLFNYNLNEFDISGRGRTYKSSGVGPGAAVSKAGRDISVSRKKVSTMSKQGPPE